MQLAFTYIRKPARQRGAGAGAGAGASGGVGLDRARRGTAQQRKQQQQQRKQQQHKQQQHKQQQGNPAPGWEGLSPLSSTSGRGENCLGIKNGEAGMVTRSLAAGGWRGEVWGAACPTAAVPS